MIGFADLWRRARNPKVAAEQSFQVHVSLRRTGFGFLFTKQRPDDVGCHHYGDMRGRVRPVPRWRGRQGGGRCR